MTAYLLNDTVAISNYPTVQTVSEKGAFVTSAGSRFVESIRDDITHDFGTLVGSGSVASLIDGGSVNGSAAADSIDGGAMFSTGPIPSSSCIFRSAHSVNYSNDTGHAILGDMTFMLDPTSAAITGSAKMEWGFSDGTNGFGYGYDIDGYYTWLKKNNQYITQKRQSEWNGDTCAGQSGSEFTRAGTPEAIRIDRLNFYRMMGEFLYAAEQTFFVKTPSGPAVQTNVHEYANAHTGSSLSSADLSLFVELHNDTVSSGSIVARCGSWRGGIFSSKVVGTGLTPNDVYDVIRLPGRHTGNSTTSPLNGNDTYRGTWFEWQNHYTGLSFNLSSDVPGTLFVDFSEADSPVDGSDADVTTTIPRTGYSYNPSDDSLLARIIPVQSRWTRMRYVNSDAAQSRFSIITTFLTTYPGSTIRPVDKAPLAGSMAGSTTAVIVAKDYASSSFTHVEATANSAGKKGLNVNVTQIETDILLRSFGNVRTGQAFVGTSAIQVLNPPLSNRRELTVKNDGRTILPSRVFFGTSAAVTTSPGPNAGFCLAVSESITLKANSSVPLWLICENTSGSRQSDVISGSSATGTAASPSNALSNDSIYATISSAGQTIGTKGFSLTPIFDTIQSIKIGVKANRSGSLFEPVTHQETVSGSAGNVGSVTTSTSVTAVSGNFYLAAVSRESVAVVTSISGLGLTWTQVTTEPSDDSHRTLDVWKGTGVPTSNAVVTANFSTLATNSHIAVSRYSNVDPPNPITAFQVGNANSNVPSVTVASSTANGLAYGAVAHDNTTMSVGVGFTLRNDDISVAAPKDSLGTETKALAIGGAQVVNTSLSAGTHWSMIALTLQPISASVDVATVQYSLSGTLGVTTGSLSFSSITDTTQYVDITSDRTWLFSDITFMSASMTGTTVGVAPINVDQLFLLITESSQNSTYVSLLEVAE